MNISRKNAIIAAVTTAALIRSGAHAATRKPAVIIVGGGSAGAVLAARLSEDPSREVLLLEAGPNFAPNAYPAALTNAAMVASPDFDWKYSSEDRATLGHDVFSPRGKVVGGSSAVNGSVAMRARPSDFTRWTGRGIEGWSWNEVLPAYMALENTLGGADSLHGRKGPLPIRQRAIAELSPSTHGFVEASRSKGLASVNDLNGQNPDGVGP